MVDMIEKLVKDRCGKRTILCVDNLRTIPTHLRLLLQKNKVHIFTPDTVRNAAGLETTALYFVNISPTSLCVQYLQTRLRHLTGSELIAMHFYFGNL